MPIKKQCGAICGSVLGVPIGFALEVLGAAGAVWGSSEVFGCRNNEDNNATFKYIAQFMGTLALARFLLKFYHEPAQQNRHAPTFWSAFEHAVVAPHEAIKDDFFSTDHNPAFANIG